MDDPRPREATQAATRALPHDRLTIVLPWDLDPRLRAFPQDPAAGALVVVETRAKPQALPFHRQKLALVVSALRHFVAERRAAGLTVEHVVADDYASAITDVARWTKPAEIHITAPREWAIDRRIRALGRSLPITVHDDGGDGGHFLLSRKDVAAWLRGRKVIRQHQFYAMMRKRFGILLARDGTPLGGRWSLDAENREHARGIRAPQIPWFSPDAITKRAMRFAERAGRWGKLEPFGWPVTRDDALAWLDAFVRQRFSAFGRYEDAIRSDERFLFHSLLSPALNLGLLHPREVLDAALEAYASGAVPLASTEGFVRQILGWRELIRGVYWHLMPELRHANQLDAHLPLPAAFWEPERTDLQCLREALASVRDTGYAHHIERLMVICNYATLAGIDPRPVSHWFWAGFVDAYEWVELPNVVGMGMFGTDAFTTKPYVASAAYILRQSGMPASGKVTAKAGPTLQVEAPCAHCRYDPKRRTGPDACPLNAMYWDFLARHRARLEENPRMKNLVGNLDRLGPELVQIRRTADAHRATIEPAPPTWTFDDDAG